MSLFRQWKQAQNYNREKPVPPVPIPDSAFGRPSFPVARLDTPSHCKRCGGSIAWYQVDADLVPGNDGRWVSRDKRSRVGKFVPLDADGGRHVCGAKN